MLFRKRKKTTQPTPTREKSGDTFRVQLELNVKDFFKNAQVLQNDLEKRTKEELSDHGSGLGKIEKWYKYLAETFRQMEEVRVGCQRRLKNPQKRRSKIPYP